MVMVHGGQVKPTQWPFSVHRIAKKYRDLHNSSVLRLPLWEGSGIPNDVSGHELNPSFGAGQPTWHYLSQGITARFRASQDTEWVFNADDIGALSLTLAEITVIWIVDVPTSPFNDWSEWWTLETGVGFQTIAEITSTGKAAIFNIGGVSGGTSASGITDLRGAGVFHLVFTASASGNFNHFYENGQLVDSDTWSATAAATDLSIGGRLGAVDRFIDSDILSLTILHRAVTTSEVALLSADHYGDITPEWDMGVLGGVLAVAAGGIRNPVGGPMTLRTPLGIS